MECFLRAALQRAVTLKAKQIQPGTGAVTQENDPSLSQMKKLNVPDFDFLGDTVVHPSSHFLSAQLALGDDGGGDVEEEGAGDNNRSGASAGAGADGAAPWAWNSNNPIRSEIEGIRRFCFVAQQFSDRERLKQDKEKARTRARTQRQPKK